MGDAPVLLEVRDLRQEYGSARLWRRGSTQRVSAVADISFSVAAGETFGLVGETGCGKSSTARSIVQAPPPVSGEVVFRGQNLTQLRGKALRRARRPMQMVFQDPYASVDPRWRVHQIIEEPMLAYGLPGGAERVRELLGQVGLDPSRHAQARPGQLSGGECQRVAIARALAARPELLICDEAVSALDVSIRAQILNLFEQLRSEVGLAYLFITHDLSVVRHVSDRLGVMYLGILAEVGPTTAVFGQPRHPYTASLLASIPSPDPAARRQKAVPLRGGQPSPLDPPSGCRFRTRCPRAEQICAEERPALRQMAGSVDGHLAACHFPLEIGSAAVNGATIHYGTSESIHHDHPDQNSVSS